LKIYKDKLKQLFCFGLLSVINPLRTTTDEEKQTRSTQTWSGFHEKTGHCEKRAKQFQGNIWPGI